MANRLKGEVEVKFGEGDDERTIVFRLGINELITLQSALGLEADDEKFLVALDHLRGLKQVRQVVRHAMLHADSGTTEEQAGEVITELGLRRIGEVIKETLRWATPEREATSEADKGKGGAASPGAMPS